MPMDEHASFILAKKSELKRVLNELRDSQVHMTSMARIANDIMDGSDTAKEIGSALRPK